MRYKDRELFDNGRFLFIKNNCPHCAKYLEFIERFNLAMPIQKKIKVINCTKYLNYGMVDNPLILKFWKYIQGFPTLFFEGKGIFGANTREEAEAFLKVLCEDDFKIPMTMHTKLGNSLTFDKNCSFKDTIIGKRRIVCE